jgi:phosphohistidine swiveling domain-containing protein
MKKKTKLKGIPACPLGKTAGYIVFIKNKNDLLKIKNNSILAAYSTYPELVDSIFKSRAVLTKEGGITSHAAILCREIAKPCIINLENLFDLKNGDYVFIDSNKGVVEKINPKRRIQSDRWKSRPFILWYYMMFAKHLAAINLGSSFIKDIDLKIENGNLHLDRLVEQLYIEKLQNNFKKDPKQFCLFHINNANKGIKKLEKLYLFLKKAPPNFETYIKSILEIEALGRCVILSRYPIPEIIENELNLIIKDKSELNIVATTSSLTGKKYYSERLFKNKNEILKKYKNKKLKLLLNLLEKGQKVREESHFLFAQKIFPLIKKMINSFGKNKEFYLPSEILNNKKVNILSRKKENFVLDYEIISKEIEFLSRYNF